MVSNVPAWATRLGARQNKKGFHEFPSQKDITLSEFAIVGQDDSWSHDLQAEGVPAPRPPMPPPREPPPSDFDFLSIFAEDPPSPEPMSRPKKQPEKKDPTSQAHERGRQATAVATGELPSDFIDLCCKLGAGINGPD